MNRINLDNPSIIHLLIVKKLDQTMSLILLNVYGLY